MKKYILYFFSINYKTLIGLVSGTIFGYFYWNLFGMEWGTYPGSSECWVNCIFGSLAGGLIGSLLSKNESV